MEDKNIMEKHVNTIQGEGNEESFERLRQRLDAMNRATYERWQVEETFKRR